MQAERLKTQLMLPSYFVAGQYSRFVYPGDVRVRADGPGRVSVVLVNDSTAARVITLQLQGAAR